MNKTSFSREELEVFAKHDIGFYGLDISRISSVLIAQVIQMQNNRVINTHQMLDEIKFLEGIKKLSSTKKAEVFRKHPLKGLMKKHFTDASFIIKNLGAHFGYEYGGNKRLEAMVNEAFTQNKSGFVDDAFIDFIAYNSTILAFEDRASRKKLSGEWIVFQEYQSKNYYLTLAAHDEGDENIFKRVQIVYNFDFQFLRYNA